MFEHRRPLRDPRPLGCRPHIPRAVETAHTDTRAARGRGRGEYPGIANRGAIPNPEAGIGHRPPHSVPEDIEAGTAPDRTIDATEFRQYLNHRMERSPISWMHYERRLYPILDKFFKENAIRSRGSLRVDLEQFQHHFGIARHSHLVHSTNDRQLVLS